MKKKRSAGKIIGIILGSIFLLLLLAALAVFAFANSLLGKIDRTEITGNMSLSEDEIYEEPTLPVEDSYSEIEEVKKEFAEAQKITIPEKAGVENILLIGADKRDKSENGRSDTIMLLSLNYNTGKIHLTSFMRAMYVCIPRADGNVWGMINAAYSWGGPNLLIDTIELNFRVNIDHYVVIDFAGFQNAVDLLGGVEVDLSADEARAVVVRFRGTKPAGRYLLNGEQALYYARLRYLDNDFVRTSRQRIVIEALMKKALDMDLSTLIQLANQILPTVHTDSDFSNVKMIGYITRALPMINNISQRMLPVENEAGNSYFGIIYVGGREMYRVNFSKNINALHEFINS